MTFNWSRVASASFLGTLLVVLWLLLAAVATAEDFAHFVVEGGITLAGQNHGEEHVFATDVGGGVYKSQPTDHPGGGKCAFFLDTSTNTQWLIWRWKAGDGPAHSADGDQLCRYRTTVDIGPWPPGGGGRVFSRFDGGGTAIPETSAITVFGGGLLSAAPVANAGSDQEHGAECDGVVEVQFDAGGSTDDEGIVSYTWTINGDSYDGAEQAVELGPGEYTCFLVVEDGDEQTDEDTMIVTIIDGCAVVPEKIENIAVKLPEDGGCGGVEIVAKATNPKWGTGARTLNLRFDRSGWNVHFGSHSQVIIHPALAPMLAGKVAASEALGAIPEPDARALVQELVLGAANGAFGQAGAGPGGGVGAAIGDVLQEAEIPPCADRDGDGIPDDVDPDPDVPAEAGDSDGDGLADEEDPCPWTVDCDGDGISDYYDADPRNYNVGQSYGYDATQTARLAPDWRQWAYARANPGMPDGLDLDDVHLSMPEVPSTGLEGQSFGEISQQDLELGWSFTGTMPFAESFGISSDFGSWDALSALGLELADALGIFRQMMSCSISVWGLTRVVKDLAG